MAEKEKSEINTSLSPLQTGSLNRRNKHACKVMRQVKKIVKIEEIQQECKINK